VNEDPQSNDQPLSDRAESLSRVTFFKRLERDELEHLATRVQQVTFSANETIFNENDKGDALYVIDSGAVRISFPVALPISRSSPRAPMS